MWGGGRRTKTGKKTTKDTMPVEFKNVQEYNLRFQNGQSDGFATYPFLHKEAKNNILNFLNTFFVKVWPALGNKHTYMRTYNYDALFYIRLDMETQRSLEPKLSLKKINPYTQLVTF